jgi:hypothetical protein
MESRGVYGIAPGRGLGSTRAGSAAGRIHGHWRKCRGATKKQIDGLRVDAETAWWQIAAASFQPEEAVCKLRTLVRDKAKPVAPSGNGWGGCQRVWSRCTCGCTGWFPSGMAILRAIAEPPRLAPQLTGNRIVTS